MAHGRKEGAKRRRWYVLEGDWGGQPLASIPVFEIDPDIARRALAYLDRLCGGQNDGTRLTVFQETEAFDEFDAASREDGGASLRSAFERLSADQEEHADVVCVFTLPEQLRRWQDGDVRLSGWKPAGRVTGIWLLVDDLWLHPKVLDAGLCAVNHVRTLLGLPTLDRLAIVDTAST